MNRVLSLAAACSLIITPLAGCASGSKSIQPQYVSEYQYSALDCQQISMEKQRLGARVHEVTGQQDDAATTDAIAMGIGLVIFWPALFALALTDNQEDELGRLKGESDALDRAAISKRCASGYSNPTTNSPFTSYNTPARANTVRPIAGPGPRYQSPQ